MNRSARTSEIPCETHYGQIYTEYASKTKETNILDQRETFQHMCFKVDFN